MKLAQYRTMWGVIAEGDGASAGSPHLELEEAVRVLSELGYDGIELPVKMAMGLGVDRVRGLLERYGMKCTIMVFTDGPGCPGAGDLWGGPYPGFTPPAAPGERDKDKLVATHLAVFKEQVEAAQQLSPTLIVSHTLRDFFTEEMGKQFFSDALQWEKEKGYTVCHETHRSRFLFSPWRTREFVQAFPNIKLCADFSHWVNVAESDVNSPDLTQVIEDVIPLVYHTHCRVGYDQGPQVPDPRAPEWIPHTEAHERWWDAIWRVQAARGDAVSTMIGEHGPPPYQQTMPHTKEPLANIWDVNLWMQLRRQERFREVLPGDEHVTSSLKESSTQGKLPSTNPGESNLSGASGRVGIFL